MRMSRLQPSSDWLGGREISRADVPQCYEWLYPCETPIQQRVRDGPIRRIAPVMAGFTVLPPVGAGTSKSSTGKKVGRGKRGHDSLWAAGCPHSNGQSAATTDEEVQFRQAVTACMRAANGAHQGKSMPGMRRSASVPGPRARRRAEAEAAAVAPTGRKRQQQVVDDIEVWDSVSQAPSVYHDDHDDYQWEALSCETATASRLKLPERQRADKEVAEHLARNRNGWYDMHGGRFLG